MANIHVLNDELINKIAAGEVVERPASVVKELVENAIDAGSQNIKVSLKDGGRQLIQVQDDGVGMEAADARLALKRHTTSKLQHADDLFQVTTMGFRGEALASISSVSRLTLQTQTRAAESGIRLLVEDGQTQELAWQGPVGTSITIADLFYNVPARKAFLKTGAAEFAACHEYMQALALSMPSLGFTLLHNDKEIFSVGALPTNDSWPRGEKALRGRAQALFGEALVTPLLYVQSADRYARVEGLISAPGQDKGSAKYIFTFVNQRWVRDKLLRYGILRGFHSHLLKGKFPIAFLALDIDAALVDVNVHPAKAELRFQYGNEVQNAIAVTIRDALRQKSWAEAPAASAGRVERSPEGNLPSTPLPVDFDLLLGSTEAAAPMQTPPAPLPSQPVLRSEAPTPSPSSSRAGAEIGTSSRNGSSSPQQGVDRATAGAKEAPQSSLSHSRESAARTSQGDGIKRTVMSFDAQAPQAFEAPQLASKSPAYGSQSPSSFPQELTTKSPANASPGAASSPRAYPAPQLSTMSPAHASPNAYSSPQAYPQVSTKSSSTAPPSPPSIFAGEFTPKNQGETIPWDELQYIGAFARCFLLFEYKDQLLAVDQHAFHERVLYERLASDPQLLKSTQPLLMPEVLEFSPTETAELKQEQERFRRLGIHYEVISPSEIELRAVPSLLTNKDFSSLIHALLAGASRAEELSHDVLASLACHAAVRAGEDLPEGELKTLLAQARTVDFYHNCPHGRRVFRWWKQSQVAAWFDRLS